MDLDATVVSFFNTLDTTSYEAAILTTTGNLSKHQDYSYLAARLLAEQLVIKLRDSGNYKDKNTYFKHYIESAIKSGKLNPKLATSFDLKRLNDAFNFTHVDNFHYIGLKTLVDRYLIRDNNNIIIELPQAFFMRIAMGVSYNDGTKEECTNNAIKYYRVMSSFEYMPSTPTLFNSGTAHPQLSSCFVSSVEDSIDGIFGELKDVAHISKHSGGIGLDWTDIRSSDSKVLGIDGKSQGIVPFMKIFNDTLLAVNQGGKRRGAGVAYIETWHKDIYQFLELRKNTGDDRLRCHDMNTAHWIPDLFMERVKNHQKWTLFDPNEVKLAGYELHMAVGDDFKALYEKAESDKRLRSATQVLAVDLWQKMLISLFETGHPWITFKDTFNLRNPSKSQGVIKSSNLCTEIGLNTSNHELAVCNLGSINVTKMVINQEINSIKLQYVVSVAVRMLNAVIDYNALPVGRGKLSNKKYRPIGLGLMGFHTMLQQNKLSYEDPSALKLSSKLSELIQYYATSESIELAKENGPYPAFKGSSWDDGKLTHETIEEVRGNKDGSFKYYTNEIPLKFYEGIKADIKEFGIYNSTLTAIAPTATIANICGVSQSIEPHYSNLYTKVNLSGEFVHINAELVSELTELGKWDAESFDILLENHGDAQYLSTKDVPQYVINRFKNAFQIDQIKLLKCTAARQRFTDQSISMNLYMNGSDGKQLSHLYTSAYNMMLKSTYYLRTKAATTINTHSSIRAIKCSIDDSSCEACQ